MSGRTKAEIYLLCITLIWGSTFVATKVVLLYCSPFLYVLIRFSLATVIFGALFFSKIRLLKKESFLRGAILGFLLFVGFALQTVGLQYTTASKSAFITGLLVVMTPLCQIAIERRAPRLGNILGVVLVTIGLYALTSPQGSEFNIGDALTIGCALCFAFYIVYVDVFTKDHDVAQLTFVQFFIAAVGGGLSALVGTSAHLDLNATFLWTIAYLTIVATVVALFVQTKYQKDTTPTRAAIIFSVEPVIASVFAYVLLGEVVGWFGVLGGGLIISGLLVSEFSDYLFPPTSQESQRL